jgi:hypothetical protein
MGTESYNHIVRVIACKNDDSKGTIQENNAKRQEEDRDGTCLRWLTKTSMSCFTNFCKTRGRCFALNVERWARISKIQTTIKYSGNFRITLVCIFWTFWCESPFCIDELLNRCTPLSRSDLETLSAHAATRAVEIDKFDVVVEFLGLRVFPWFDMQARPASSHP